MDKSLAIASLLFGIGSWISITGLWAEIPLLIRLTPEKWTLPSKLSIFVQAANVGPVVFIIARKYTNISYVTATHVQLVIGTLSSLGLIFLWNTFVWIGDGYHSLFLFVFTFGLAIVDNTSSITFLPFMARFNPEYLTPYLIGEGLSGFIPIVVATIQGVDDQEECISAVMNLTAVENITQEENSDVLFSPSVFFVSILFTVLISWAAFFYLLYSSAAKSELISTPKPIDTVALENLIGNKFVAENKEIAQRYPKLSNRCYYYLHGLILYACFLTFGFFPGIQSYATLNYGYKTMHLVVILSGLAYPVGCFGAMVLKHRSVMIINVLTGLSTAISLFILAVALMSPHVPLNYSMGSINIGGCISVVSWIIFIGILSYVKTVATEILNEERGEKALFLVGISTQVGAFLGVVVVYFLVNWIDLFKSNCRDQRL